jgi:hypothetical protein
MKKVAFQGPEDFSGIWECKRFFFQGPEESGRLFRHGLRKKATARTSCCYIHNVTTPPTIELTTAETLASA